MERPILFSGPMVQAILAGRKTQTRRVVKPQPPDEPTKEGGKRWGMVDGDFYYCGIKCPYGKPGDRLWVRETFYETDKLCRMEGKPVVYHADLRDGQAKHAMWTPSIFMPRWASRITLEITDVRVERVQEISEEDAKAEGVSPCAARSINLLPHQRAYRILWDSINGKTHPWASNPWVWVLTFKRPNPAHGAR